MRECVKCHKVKSIEEFRMRSGKNYRERACKACRYEQSKNNPNRKEIVDKYRASEKYRATLRRGTLSKYGMSPEDYDRMHEQQHGLCAICRMPERRTDRPLSVDHDHETNIVRGLLCDDCNNLLGRANDSTSVLSKAIDYLERTGDHN